MAGRWGLGLALYLNGRGRPQPLTAHLLYSSTATGGWLTDLRAEATSTGSWVVTHRLYVCAEGWTLELYGCEFSSFDVFSRELTAFVALFTVLDTEEGTEWIKEQRRCGDGNGAALSPAARRFSRGGPATFPAFINGHAAGKHSSRYYLQDL